MRISDWSSDVCSSDLSSLTLRGVTELNPIGLVCRILRMDGIDCHVDPLGPVRALLNTAPARAQALSKVARSRASFRQRFAHGPMHINKVAHCRCDVLILVLLVFLEGDRKSTRLNSSH